MDGVEKNKVRKNVQDINYDVLRADTGKMSEGREDSETKTSPDKAAKYDILRTESLESRRDREIREAEQGKVHIDAAIDSLGETASAVLRRCYVQGLQEERFILNMLNRLKLCPEALKSPIGAMLTDHSSQDNTGKIQTIYLFEWGRDYMTRLYTSKTPELRQYLNSLQLHPNTALEAAIHVQYVKNDIIKYPEQFLLLEETEGTEAQIREETITIDNGCALSLKNWDDYQEERKERFHDLMQKGQWSQDFPDLWQKKPEEFPQIRITLDLSWLQLMYQKHSAQSLEVLEYMEEENKDDNDSTINEEVHYKSSKEKWYVTSKLTTTGGDYYTQITEIQFEVSPDTGEIQKVYQDAGAHVQSLVEPFLSGREQHSVNTILREGDILPEDYWHNEDVNWRLIAGQRQKYHGSLHPILDQFAQGEIADQKEQGAPRTVILDVAGGNGDLAERIIKNAHRNFSGRPIDYVLVDLSEPDIRLANERFHTLIASLGAQHITARAIKVDLHKYRPDPEATTQDAHREYHSRAEAMKQDLHLPPEGVNIIINSGGILNRGITNDAVEATNYLGVLTYVMKPKEGSGIYSGLTPLRITADTHAKVGGTDVHNLTDPRSGRQAHLVRRLANRETS